MTAYAIPIALVFGPFLALWGVQLWYARREARRLAALRRTLER